MLLLKLAVTVLVLSIITTRVEPLSCYEGQDAKQGTGSPVKCNPSSYLPKSSNSFINSVVQLTGAALEDQAKMVCKKVGDLEVKNCKTRLVKRDCTYST